MRLRRLLMVSLLLFIGGCGFHLRGEVALPEVMSTTQLVAPDSSLLRYELETLLLASGATVTGQPGVATAVLTLHSERLLSRVLSVDAMGRAQEYALTLTVKYSLRTAEGKLLAQQLSSRVERDFRFDPDNVLAQRGEQELVQQEMRRVAAEQILRRLRTLSLLPESNSISRSVPAS